MTIPDALPPVPVYGSMPLGNRRHQMWQDDLEGLALCGKRVFRFLDQEHAHWWADCWQCKARREAFHKQAALLLAGGVEEEA